MSAGTDLQSTLASLGRQADALGQLRLRYTQLREAPERSNAQLDGLAAAIDQGIDACLLIGERAALCDPHGSWKEAVTELEHQLRTLGVLRSKLLALYAVAPDVRCGA